MNPTDKKQSAIKDEFKDLPLTTKNHFLPANNMENIINNLSKPHFLGSIHMKNEAKPNSNLVENLLENELKLKMNKSLRSTLFNPVTKILILLAIIFNLTWLFFVYIL